MNLLTDLVGSVFMALLSKPFNPTSNTTYTNSPVDFKLASSRFQEFAVIEAGTITDGSYEVKLLESNEMFANFTDVVNGTVSLTTSNANSNIILPFYRTKRYLKAWITCTGVTTGGFLAVLAMGQQHRPGGNALVP